MGDPTKPILLRPSTALADAMATAADKAGVSRQAWMLDVLDEAARRYYTPTVDTDQLPLYVPQAFTPNGGDHTCTALTPGCYRCELNADEV